MTDYLSAPRSKIDWSKVPFAIGICGLAALTGALMDFVGGIFIEEPEALFTFALGAGLCFVWLKKPKALAALARYIIEGTTLER